MDERSSAAPTIDPQVQAIIQAQAKAAFDAANAKVTRAARRGNTAQWSAAIGSWVAALATTVAVGVAIYGLQQAQPIFQNQRLQEENARLELEGKRASKAISELNDAFFDVRGRAWTLACRIYVSQTVDQVNSILTYWRAQIRVSETLLPTFGESAMYEFRRLNSLYSDPDLFTSLRAGADVIDTFLSEEDHAAFILWMKGALEARKEELSVRMQKIVRARATPMEAIEDVSAWLDELATAKRAINSLLEDCRGAWAARVKDTSSFP